MKTSLQVNPSQIKDFDALQLRACVSQQLDFNSIMIFNGKEYLGLVGSEMNFIIPLLRTKTISLNVTALPPQINDWKVDLILEVRFLKIINKYFCRF